MPYKDREAQRKCQRLFAAKKAKAIKDAAPPFDLLKGTQQRGWEHLPTASELKALGTVGECVRTAEKFKVNTSTNRMPIAALAVRSCEIEWGGKRVKGQKVGDSIREFAVAIGIHPKTLWGWIDVYKFARDKLPKETERVKLTAVQDAMLWSNRTGEDPVELYRAFASNTDPRGKSLRAIDEMRSALFFLKRYGLKHFLPEEISHIAEWHALVGGLLAARAGEPKVEEPKPQEPVAV